MSATPSRQDELREGFKQVGEHHPDCFAARSKDGLTFILHDGNEWKRKKNGDRGGSTMWVRWRCNDTKCGAILLTRWDVLARFVNRVEG